ncbi:uncharacterized protein [Nicotiana sylvestris]|uniref:uncharacterized protein n=1 Tax=Nicotiana sylvestris TaxID=4096 RepID=UPI00388C73C3
MARKTVATREQAKKLNEKLKSEEIADEEQIVEREKSSGSRDITAAEGYNPKRKKSYRVQTPKKGMGGKNRKTVSSILVETQPTRGRTTRNQKKQNEANLKKSLAESAKKAATKGKKKSEKQVTEFK